MVGRMKELLALGSMLEILNHEDVIDILDAVTARTDWYIPTLQFLMRPDNCKTTKSSQYSIIWLGELTWILPVCLVLCLITWQMQSPVKTGAMEPLACGDAPTYQEYAIVYRAHYILCSSGFSTQLVSAMLALQSDSRSAICEQIVSCNSRDSMNLEALARFLSVIIDNYSVEALVSFFEPVETQHAFIETLLVLLHHESIRDVLLRICNELPLDTRMAERLTGQILHQLAPEQAETLPLVAQDVVYRMRNDVPHVKFARMISTCDFLTDLIHEQRTGSLGYHFVSEIMSAERFAQRLIDSAMQDLRTLPTPLANESYVIKVLNSMLQQVQCGCVSKAAFCCLAGSDPLSPETSALCAQGCPHADLPLLWQRFIPQLPQFLNMLDIAPSTQFTMAHVQMVYIMLPIINASCSVVDQHLVHAKTMESLLNWMIRFPEANILQCAISRLFIVALEDSPYMFGKELPAFRGATDPLRLHMLLQDSFTCVLDVFGCLEPQDEQPQTSSPSQPRRRPPPSFLDVAISFDQALSSAYAHSPHLFQREKVAKWETFRTTILVPTQSVWEEQYEATTAANNSPKKSMVGQMFDESENNLLSELAANVRENCRIVEPASVEPAIAVSAPTVDVIKETTLQSVGSIAVEDVPTPLSALYNEEEKSLMLNVASSLSTEPLQLPTALVTES